MISPTFRSLRGSGDSYVTDVPPPNDDIVYKMILLGSEMHPRGIEFVGQSEGADCNG